MDDHRDFIESFKSDWESTILNLSHQFNVPDELELLSNTFIRTNRNERDQTERILHAVAVEVSNFRTQAFNTGSREAGFHGAALEDDNEMLARASCAYFYGYTDYHHTKRGAFLCLPWLFYAEQLQALKEQAVKWRRREGGADPASESEDE
eukprot:Polyplicarium_translucidae@DN2729_c1_g1_i3.p2